MIFYYILSLLLIIVSLIYIYFKNVYNYWKQRGIPYVKTNFPFGNLAPLFAQKFSIGEVLANLYTDWSTERFIGIFTGWRPSLLIRDPALVRAICISDFQHFHDRGVYFDAERDPLSAHLFALPGEEWKTLRTKMNAAFTSGRLKTMFSTTLLRCSNLLQKYVNGIDNEQVTIEVREILARFTTDVIASVAFGLETNSFENPDGDFRKYGRKAFAMSAKNAFRFATFLTWPELQKFLRFSTYDSDVQSFMLNQVKDTLEYRERTNYTRKDFFQLLIQMRNMGNIVDGDENWSSVIVSDEKEKSYSINECAAQAFVVFLAGFETASSAASLCLYEISKYPEIQKKLHKEIDETLALHDNEITYNSVMDMKYLDLCVDETLRLYPPLPFLNRICTIPYQIPDTDIILEKGTPLIIPLLGLHRDPLYYEDPLVFKPERFSPQNMANKTFTEMPYLPFGYGPRICLGTRLGKLQTKVALISMLWKFEYELDEKTPRDLFLSPGSLVLASKDPLLLKLRKRKFP